MSAIFGELLTFSQEKGPDIKLRVFGDEFYARYETAEGYSVIYDPELGGFAYALLQEGKFVSSGVDLEESPPPESYFILRNQMKYVRQKLKIGFPENSPHCSFVGGCIRIFNFVLRNTGTIKCKFV